jgi:hypothetical protein
MGMACDLRNDDSRYPYIGQLASATALYFYNTRTKSWASQGSPALAGTFGAGAGMVFAPSQGIAGVIASVFIALLMYASTQRFSESVNKELESVNTKIASIHYSIRHDNLPVETVIALNIELKELEKLKEAKK